MNTQGEPCEHKGRDQGDAATNQGMSKTASKPSEAKQEAWNSFPLPVSEDTSPTDTLILDF